MGMVCPEIFVLVTLIGAEILGEGVESAPLPGAFGSGPLPGTG